LLSTLYNDGKEPKMANIRKDINKNPVKTGDVMADFNGLHMNNEGKTIYDIVLFSVPGARDGSGYYYDITGKKCKYWWAHPHESYKIDLNDYPKEFGFSFYHGMHDLCSETNEGSIKDIILNSDWEKRIIHQSFIDEFDRKNKISIKSISDILENLEDLIKDPIPTKLMYDVLEVCNTQKTNPDFGEWRGETGIAFYNDTLKYHAIMECIINTIKETTE
jgi:hypothetical protein